LPLIERTSMNLIECVVTWGNVAGDRRRRHLGAGGAADRRHQYEPDRARRHLGPVAELVDLIEGVVILGQRRWGSSAPA
jgi:hypothetical protein